MKPKQAVAPAINKMSLLMRMSQLSCGTLCSEIDLSDGVGMASGRLQKKISHDMGSMP